MGLAVNFFRPDGIPLVRVATVYNFGTVLQGEPVEHTFSFPYKGEERMVISSVEPACGCTASEPEKRTYEPGETIHLPAKLNTSGLEGNIQKHIELKYNQGQILSLALEGTVTPLIKLEPAAIQFPEATRESLQSGAPVTETMTLIPAEKNAKILDFHTDPLYLNVHQVEDLANGGKRVTLGLSPDAPEGPMETELTVTLDHPKVKELTLEIKGTILAE